MVWYISITNCQVKINFVFFSCMQCCFEIETCQLNIICEIVNFLLLRIDIKVLSVIAHQIQSIQRAIQVRIELIFSHFYTPMYEKSRNFLQHEPNALILLFSVSRLIYQQWILKILTSKSTLDVLSLSQLNRCRQNERTFQTILR